MGCKKAVLYTPIGWRYSQKQLVLDLESLTNLVKPLSSQNNTLSTFANVVTVNNRRIFVHGHLPAETAAIPYTQKTSAKLLQDVRHVEAPKDQIVENF